MLGDMIIHTKACQGHGACPRGDRNTPRGAPGERCGTAPCRVRTQLHQLLPAPPPVAIAWVRSPRLQDRTEPRRWPESGQGTEEMAAELRQVAPPSSQVRAVRKEDAPARARGWFTGKDDKGPGVRTHARMVTELGQSLRASQTG